jgi:hypothetical protein
MVDDRIQVRGLEFVWGRIPLTGNRVEGIRSELVGFAEDLPIYQSEDEAFKDELYKLIGNLPLTTVGTPYEIVSSITISATSFNRTRPQGKTPRVRKPIKMIQLRPKLVQWCKSIRDPVVYIRFIAAGFDLLLGHPMHNSVSKLFVCEWGGVAHPVTPSARTPPAALHQYLTLSGCCQAGRRSLQD